MTPLQEICFGLGVSGLIVCGYFYFSFCFGRNMRPPRFELTDDPKKRAEFLCKHNAHPSYVLLTQGEIFQLIANAVVNKKNK